MARQRVGGAQPDGRARPWLGVLVVLVLLVAFSLYQSQHAFADGSNERNPGLYIGVNNPAVDTMTIATDETITDLDLYVDIDHTFIGDFTIDLLHVGTGTTVRVWDRHCATAEDITTTFDDEGSALVCPPGASTIPYASLSAFDGESSAGDWEVTVDDLSGADNGTLNTWRLEWKNGFVVDGQDGGEWGSAKPKGDGTGDADNDNQDIATTYATKDSNNVYFRVDTVATPEQSQVQIYVNNDTGGCAQEAGHPSDTGDVYDKRITATYSGGWSATMESCSGGTWGSSEAAEVAVMDIVEIAVPLSSFGATDDVAYFVKYGTTSDFAPDSGEPNAVTTGGLAARSGLGVAVVGLCLGVLMLRKRKVR